MTPIIGYALLFAIGAILGVLLTLWLRPAATTDAQPRIAALEERLKGNDEDLSRQRQEISTLNSEVVKKQGIIGELTGQLNEAKAAAQKEITAFKDAAATAEDRFAALAGKALRDNNESFLQLAESKLDEKHTAFNLLVEPVTATLTKLDERVIGMQQQEAELIRETRTIASAMSQSSARGRWGELQLKRIAELAGMLEQCDFELQSTVSSEAGKMQRPDMVVRLPNGRCIIVDSKAPYSAYEEAAALNDHAQKSAKLVEYARQVKTQIDQLSRKSYPDQVSGAADFVVCFLPGESFFAAAISTDPTLLEYAAERNVVLASPSSLITLLRAVHLGWNEQRLAASAREISELGRTLYERLGAAVKHLETLRRTITGSVDAYNKLVGSLERSVLPQARRFRELGAGASNNDEIPIIEPVEELARPLQGLDWKQTRLLNNDSEDAAD